MENFTKELNDLLVKYPDLGEFSIHIHPRVTIDVVKPKAPPVVNIPQVSTEPRVVVPANGIDPDVMAASLEKGVASRMKGLIEAVDA